MIISPDTFYYLKMTPCIPNKNSYKMKMRFSSLIKKKTNSNTQLSPDEKNKPRIIFTFIDSLRK